MSETPVHDWTAPFPTLGTAEIHLWYCKLEAEIDPRLPGRYEALLDAQEHARLQRLRFARDRHRFLLSHAFTRCVLARYLGDAPQDLQFRRGIHGKPEVDGLEFNLSHSDSHAALAVAAPGPELGLDIEHHRDGRRFAALATRYFAQGERRQLAGLEGLALQGRFYDFWTLKEAYLKARGAGLTLPLGDFAFDFETATAAIAFEARPELDPDSHKWVFWSYRAPGPCSLAVALRDLGPVPRTAPRCHVVQPLLAWSTLPWTPLARS